MALTIPDTTSKRIRLIMHLRKEGVAVGRALIAVMENYYDPADDGIVVPDVLRPYMGGWGKYRNFFYSHSCKY